MTMKQIPGYVGSECDRCNGTGQRLDITCADKINAGPFAARCAHCTGSGAVYVSEASLAMRAKWDKERETRLADQEVGEIPNWML